MVGEERRGEGVDKGWVKEVGKGCSQAMTEEQVGKR